MSDPTDLHKIIKSNHAIYMANLVIVDGKVVKNRTGKHGDCATLKEYRAADIIVSRGKIIKNLIDGYGDTNVQKK